MSDEKKESIVRERLSNALTRVLNIIEEGHLDETRNQLRLMTALIQALYWLERYRMEQYFKNKSKEEENNREKRTKKRKVRV
jgi:hypothetical protein